jgi:Protein of unknown function (DUF1566)
MKSKLLTLIFFSASLAVSSCQSWEKFWQPDAVAKTDTVAAKLQSNLPDTGLALCASGALGDSTLLTCPQSVTGQDGDFANTPRARSYSGPTQHATFSTNYTTKDNVTGLVWKSCPEGLSGATCLTGSISSIDWNTATAGTCSSLNAANSGSGYAGITSWRMPDLPELWRITNYSLTSPALDTASFPPATFTNDAFWSATANTPTPANAWFVNTISGLVDTGGKGVAHYLRCVSGTTASVSLVNNGDNTVSDQTTLLRWQRCSRGLNNDAACSGTTLTADWVAALSYCQGLSLAGRTWRLPSINELLSLVDYSTSNPSIRSDVFPGTASNLYWTSTTPSTTGNAWNISFASGFSGSAAKTVGLEVRCVADIGL